VAEAEFRYSDLLPTDADDAPYRLITTDGASAVLCLRVFGRSYRC
jgi:fumarate hydratase class I